MEFLPNESVDSDLFCAAALFSGKSWITGSVQRKLTRVMIKRWASDLPEFLARLTDGTLSPGYCLFVPDFAAVGLPVFGSFDDQRTASKLVTSTQLVLSTVGCSKFCREVRQLRVTSPYPGVTLEW